MERNPGGLITDYLIGQEIIQNHGTWLTCKWSSGQSLSKDRMTKINDQHILYVLNHDLVNLKKVKGIELSGRIKITDTSLINITNKCPSLVWLVIDGCVKITDTGIAAIVEKFGAQLKALIYWGCVKCGDAAFESIVMHCTQLELLEANNTGITVIPL